MGFKVLHFYFFVNAFFSFSLNASSFNRLQGMDHGPLDEKHDHSAKNFIEENLKHEGRFSLQKVDSFIEKIKEEKKILKKDIYETKVLETVELTLKKPKKARKKGNKKAKVKNSNMLKGYDLYLLPKLKELRTQVEKNNDIDLCESLAADFVRGYIPYYLPNAHRTPWPRDVDLEFTTKKLFERYKIKKNDSQKVEASNLVVEDNNVQEVSAILGSKISSGSYLSQGQLDILQERGFDISQLNPGVSALWDPVSEDKIRKVVQEDSAYFPRDDQTLYYKTVILRGHASPKLKVFYYKDGKKKHIKLKMGQEVHGDLAASKVFELLGLNQDQMLYKEKVRVNLNGTSFDELKTYFVNKYGLERFSRFISAHGGEKGHEWVEIHDVLLETRENPEMRVSSCDMSSWDLTNRREYRALLLAWAWVGQNNSKFANFKFLYEKIGGNLRPRIRLHDTGSSLGAPTSLRKMKNIMGLLEFGRVNDFPSHLLKVNKNQDEIKITWNDLVHLKRYFQSTTWNDLRWMAEKIAAVCPESLSKVLMLSGFPEPVAKLYYIKLMMRRNEIVKAFSLEDRYPLINLPDLKNLKVKDEDGSYVIRKGKLVKKFFPGKNDIYEVQEKWLTFLPKLLAFNIPVAKWRNTENGQQLGTSLRMLDGVKADLGVKEDKSPVAITTLPIGIGAQAILSRRVSTNMQLVNTGDKIRMYKITDSLKLRFALDSPLLRKTMKKVKFVGADVGLRFYEYEVRFVHYEDRIKEAYLKDFILHKIFTRPNYYAAYRLQPLELIKSYHRYGVEIDAGVGVYGAKPAINNEVSFTGGVKQSLSYFYVRDEYGHLHVYQDKLRSKYIGFNFNLAEVGLLFTKLPFFRTQVGASKYQYNMSDHVFKTSDFDRYKAADERDDEQKEQEYLWLKELAHRTSKVSEAFADSEYALEARGKSYKRGLGALFLFNKDKSKSRGTIQVKLPTGEVKRYMRQTVERTKYKGADSKLVPLFDVLMARRKKVRTALEMDLDKLENFILVSRVEEYYRVKKPDELDSLIKGLNIRYSQSDKKPFFRKYKLPDFGKVEKYKKVYAHTRIFIDGQNFVNRLLEVDRGVLKDRLYNHFSQRKYRALGSYFLESSTKKVIETIDKIQYQFRDPSGYDSKKVIKYLVRVIDLLEMDRLGSSFLRELCGLDGLFVMGEIAGVYPSFTSLQDLQQLARRRFAAKSWGKFNKVSPLQKFLRYNRLVVPSVFIDKSLSDDVMFGALEQAVPPNIEYLYGHGTKF